MNRVRYTCFVDVMEDGNFVHSLKVNVFNQGVYDTTEELKEEAFRSARSLLPQCKYSNKKFYFVLRNWEITNGGRIFS